MKKIALSFFTILLFLFSGCTYKREINISKSYIVTIKMKNIVFSDLGFLNYGKDYTNLQLFSAGNLILDLKIGEYICINSHCFEKKEFNRRFLSPLYDENTLENILNKQTIFDKIGYKKSDSGFSQIIKQKNLNLKYFVSKDKIYFKDYKNHILIKLTAIKR